jgi:hypothetical protein
VSAASVSKPPICPTHAVAMDRVMVEGAPLHGQSWWICGMVYSLGLVQRSTCGTTAVRT